VTRGQKILAGSLATLLFVLAGCSAQRRGRPGSVTAAPSQHAEPVATPALELIAGMPPYVSATNVYAAAGPDQLIEAVRGDKPLVYVPNTGSNDVWVIDPSTYQVVDKFPGGPEPQHVVPSYDLRTLYVASSQVPSGGLVPIDPRTGRPGKLIDVQDVHNLYFTPDGKQGIAVAESHQRLDFYDAKTWQRTSSVSFPECAGISYMDYSVDGRTMLVSCEFANRMLVVDAVTHQKLRQLDLDVASDGMPQDTRLTPDGRHFLVADMNAGGVYVFDGAATRRTGFIPTGKGAHGIYFSRDGTLGYVTNRDEGSVSLIDLSTLTPAGLWRIPGGGSPDMGGLSADGRVLWLSGRDHNEVYAMSTADGRLLARIPVGTGPHGLTIWPQPGRYSLGHTTNLR
jgi:YVTN family beta-propeller protein